MFTKGYISLPVRDTRDLLDTGRSAHQPPKAQCRKCPDITDICPELKNIHHILKSHWGYDSFRPLQEEIIRAVLNGKDTLAIMPTGGGKSVCFQTPAIAMPGICLVVTPLIALMKDQVENLRRRNIPALFIHSGMNFREVKNALNSARHGDYKFLYVSPERLQTSLFNEYLPALPVNLIAVDEAHCISQWGYDFRPAYLQIARVREEKPNVPVLALTASATLMVQQDICDKLQLQQPQLFQQSYERPNLSYSVFDVEIKINKLLEIVKNVPGSGIIYCRSRRRTVEISELLQLHGISAGHYHAGLTHDERNERQEKWVRNDIRLMVCTNAFGMGIDKPDVRLVIHFDIPDCVENYYQEAGRAGRDGKKSYAVLLYTETDLSDLEVLPESRFPALPEIRRVYQSLVNYLQLPAGSGELRFFDFDLDDFSKKFQLPALLVMYAIKALEQESVIYYTDQLFAPSTVMFTCSREYLQQVETASPAFDAIIKFLLRSYGGILDVPVAVSEKLIAKVLRKTPEEIRTQLTRLQAMGIIDYQPQKEKPQLQFLSPRVAADELFINQHHYEKRKQVLAEQIAAMIRYTRYSDCRACFIGAYFNDHSLKPCGSCDNCLRHKKTPITKEEFDALYSTVMQLLSQKSMGMKELLIAAKTGDQTKLRKVVEYLVSEGKLEIEPHRGEPKLKAIKKGQG